MSKELKKQESTAVATQEMADAWGESSISAKDIVIPKILLMQGLSKLVSDEQAKMGDLVDSMSSDVLGKSLDIIPFHLEKVWIVSKKEAGDYKFMKIDPITIGDEERPYEEEVEGEFYKNEYCMNFYCLRPEDMSLPYIVSFKGMSRRSGQQLATQMFVKNKAAGKIPPARVMTLSADKTKNDKGTFYVLQTKVSRDSNQEEINQAFNWFKTVNSGGVKAHQESVDTAPEAEERF